LSKLSSVPLVIAAGTKGFAINDLELKSDNVNY
jgi:hypothetical protein